LCKNNFARKKPSYHVYCTDILEGGLGTAKLFVGMVGKDVTANIMDGATHRCKHLLQAFYYKVHPKFATI